MMNTSMEFKDLIRNGAKIVNYADITLKNGTILSLTPEDFSVGGFTIVDETTDGKFGMGNAISKQINIIISNHIEQYSNYDFYKAIIHMYVAVHTSDGRILKERKGKYYVINPTSPGDVIKISGVDSMYLFDKPYNTATGYPATLQSILSDCCIECGVNIGFKQFDNWNFVVNNKPEDVTYREVVSYVAQIAGYNARINTNDALELVWYDSIASNEFDGGKFITYEEADSYDGGDFLNYNQDVLIDGGNFTDSAPANITKISSLSVGTDDIEITGIKVAIDSENYEIVGTEEYMIVLEDNPLTTGKEKEIAANLGNRIIGLRFRPMKCQIINNPFLEPFDSCFIYDRKGNSYFSLINSVTYKIGGFTKIECKAEDPVRNESSYSSESARAYVQVKKNMEMQFSNYEKAVQNMDMLAANSMGLYRDSEKQADGSEIYYQSNRPIVKNSSGKCQFEANSVVYKMTGDGFFVSTDGGLSFTAGFDSNGKAVVNVLSAIGITFDWAKGGTLTLGGDDNIAGKAVIFDKDKNQLGSWDNLGFWTKSTDYVKESPISYRRIGNAGCGDINNVTSFKIIGAPGADRISEKAKYIYKGSDIMRMNLGDPVGYVDSTYPYWEFSDTGILTRVDMYEDYNTPDGGLESIGFLKEIQCYQNDTLIYFRDYAKYNPANGIYADLRNGFFQNKTWKIEGGNVFKNNALLGQTILLGNTLQFGNDVIEEDVEHFFKFSSLMLVSEHKTNKTIANISTFSTEIFKTIQPGYKINNGTSNYATVTFNGYQDYVFEGTEIQLGLSVSSTNYIAKLYGIV